jgi:hypothetical protein
MGVGTKVALGVGAAAAAGSVVALTGSSDEGSDDGIVESIEDLSGVWVFSGSCIAQGCTADLVCAGPPEAPLLNCCGMDLCNCCELNVGMEISQSGNILSGRILSAQGNPEGSTILNGTVNVSSVLFTIQPDGIMPVGPTAITQYTGTIEDSAIIRGTFSGSGYHPIVSGGTRLVTWSGTFTATIRKE